MRLSERDRRLVHRIASLLLSYPDDDVLGQVAVAQAAAADLPARVGRPLLRLADHLRRTDPTALRTAYVETFDLRRRCCPYLTYCTAGDTRRRGAALLRFSTAYRMAGMEPEPGELPDHLAVVLEFAATGDQQVATELLVEHRAGLDLLAAALSKAGSPYASALDAVLATLPRARRDDLAAARQVGAAGPPVESVGLEPYGARSTSEGERR